LNVDSIISWSDNRISYGRVYEKLGFECGKGKIEAGDGWVSYMEEGSPELMLKNLRSLLDEDKK